MARNDQATVHIVTRMRYRLPAGSDTAPLQPCGGDNSLHYRDGEISHTGPINLVGA